MWKQIEDLDYEINSEGLVRRISTKRIKKSFKRPDGYFITITHNEGVWKESMDNYEDARLECLKKLIELCKKN